jgi:hypothetical protein
MKTLDYIKSQEHPNGGLRGWTGSPAYPEVTGYTIPTLLQWGETELANRLADWLVSVQNSDGSFNDMEGKKPYMFDTGAAMEGLLAAGKKAEADKARQWLMSQFWGKEAYLIRVAGLLDLKRDVSDIEIPNRTHYWAYALEGFYRMGRTEFVRHELELLPNGLQPYSLDGQGSDTSATAQIGVLRAKLGMDVSRFIGELRRMMNHDGSFPHDLGNPKKTLWGCKFYLDLEYLLQNRKDEPERVQEFQFDAFNIDTEKWAQPKPFGISGCFRVRNDDEFLYEAVASHLPYLDEAVIALQPSDEATEKEVKRLLHDFPDKVRVERYPVAPVFITDPEWEGTPENSIKSFVHLSNWALTQCKYSWIARIEADVICLSTFAKIRERIENEPEAKRLYGRVLLNVAGKEQNMVSATNPRNGGWDECVFQNRPECHFIRKPRYEVLDCPDEAVCMGWSALHMKRCKRDKIGWNNETYVKFNKTQVRKVLKVFNETHPYPAADNPLGEDCLYERK